jgi:hypothetical protein
MNKQIMGIIAAMLMLGTALSPAPETTGNIDFAITIQKDTTISISDLRTEGGSALSFEPGINSISEDEYALPKNACETADVENATNPCYGLENSDIMGQWDITNEGNAPAYVYIKVNSALPDGITSEIGNEKTYDAGHYKTLSESNNQYVDSPLAKTETMMFWQRIAATAIADGGDTQNRQVVITSFPTVQI